MINAIDIYNRWFREWDELLALDLICRRREYHIADVMEALRVHRLDWINRLLAESPGILLRYIRDSRYAKIEQMNRDRSALRAGIDAAERHLMELDDSYYDTIRRVNAIV